MNTRNWFVFNIGRGIGSVLLRRRLSGRIVDQFSLRRAHGSLELRRDATELASRVMDLVSIKTQKQTLSKGFSL